jgi:hypothetical protein
MNGRLCHILSLGVFTLVALTFTACGGGSDSTVARVAGVGSISNAMLDHWMTIEARLLYQEVPTRPVPKGVVPDPPAYTACIAYLRSAVRNIKSTTQKIGEDNSRLTVAQLRDKCAHQQQELKVLTLNTLIGWDWTIGQGLEIGVKVSDAEAGQRIEALKKEDLTGVDFQKYLKYSGQTRSDMLLRAKTQLVEVKLGRVLESLAKQLPKGLSPQQRQASLAKLLPRLSSPRQWVTKTSCKTGYVTSSCKQYRGSMPPGIPN